MNKYKNVFLIFLISLLIPLLISCSEGVVGPKQPSYAEIYDGIYERVYPIVNDWDNRLPNIVIYMPREQTFLMVEAEEIEGEENKFRFTVGERLEPNYPNLPPYEIDASDMKIWTEERNTAGKNFTLNGTFLESVFISGDNEVARFRIDVNDRVYPAFN